LVLHLFLSIYLINSGFWIGGYRLWQEARGDAAAAEGIGSLLLELGLGTNLD